MEHSNTVEHSDTVGSSDIPVGGDAPAHGEVGRPNRRRHTDEKIVDAVLDILREHGPGDVTIEHVSESSGVAKTTLYRRYPDRYAMLEAVAVHMHDRVNAAAQNIVGLAEDVSFESFEAIVAIIQEHVNERVGLRLLGNILVSGDRVMAVWRERLVQPQLIACRMYFQRGVDQGVFSPDADHDLIQEFLIGSALANIALSGGALPPTWAHQVATALWQLLTAPAVADAGGTEAAGADAGGTAFAGTNSVGSEVDGTEADGSEEDGTAADCGAASAPTTAA